MRIFLLSFFLVIISLRTSAQNTINELTNALQENLDSMVQSPAIPGISFSIRFDSINQINLASGFADKDKGIKMTSQHKLLAGSVGKVFFTGVILKLVEEEKINLNDKASDYLSHKSWYKTFPNHEDIKIVNLLNHTSGLPRHLFQPEFLQEFLKNPLKKRLPEECIQSISNKPAVHPVGKGWAYSDTNFILLGLIIESVMNTDIYNLVNTQFLKPLNLENTVASTSKTIEGLANGYVGAQNPFQLPNEVLDGDRNLVLDPSFEWTGGGFATTPSDLTSFIKYIHESTYLNDETKLQMKKAINMATGQDYDTGYGLGTFIFGKMDETRYGHYGFFPGYVSHVEYSPKRQYALAIQINNDGAYPLLQQVLYNLEQTVNKFLDKIDEKNIINNFKAQEDCWNKGDILCYMTAYTKEESIQTVSRNGVTYGYDNILGDYKKYFPKDSMGKLHFDNLKLKRLSDNLYFVTGRFNLKFENRDELYQGWFSVNMKRIKGQWKMITDHSS